MNEHEKNNYTHKFTLLYRYQYPQYKTKFGIGEPGHVCTEKCKLVYVKDNIRKRDRDRTKLCVYMCIDSNTLHFCGEYCKHTIHNTLCNPSGMHEDSIVCTLTGNVIFDYNFDNKAPIEKDGQGNMKMVRVYTDRQNKEPKYSEITKKINKCIDDIFKCIFYCCEEYKKYENEIDNLKKSILQYYQTYYNITYTNVTYETYKKDTKGSIQANDISIFIVACIIKCSTGEKHSNITIFPTLKWIQTFIPYKNETSLQNGRETPKVINMEKVVKMIDVTFNKKRRPKQKKISSMIAQMTETIKGLKTVDIEKYIFQYE